MKQSICLFKKEKYNNIEKHNETLDNFSNTIKNGFDSELVKKTKIKSYEGKITTNVHNYKIPKEGSRCFCLSIILILLLSF